MLHHRQINRPPHRRYDRLHLAAQLRDPKPLVERMAETMRQQHAHGGCTAESLLDAGYTLEEIDSTSADARRLATKQATRQADDCDIDPAIARAARIERAACLATGLVSDQNIASYLLQNGYGARELGDILPSVIDRICELLIVSRQPSAQVQ